MPAWPWDLALIRLDTYNESVEPNVSRTPFEDGAIAQKRTASRDWLLRRFDIFVYHENRVRFRSWLKQNAHKFFDFRDLDGTTRQARVRGGNGAVQLDRESGFLNGKKYWSASVELEGYE